jgi:hypothetical protein
MLICMQALGILGAGKGSDIVSLTLSYSLLYTGWSCSNASPECCFFRDDCGTSVAVDDVEINNMTFAHKASQKGHENDGSLVKTS